MCLPASELQSFSYILTPFDVYQVFFSPQGKRWSVITYERGIYKFPYELPNDVRLTISRN